MICNVVVPKIFVDKVPVFLCNRCGYKWFPRNLNPENLQNINKPRTCPNRKCHNPFWDEERKYKLKAAKKKSAKKSARKKT